MLVNWKSITIERPLDFCTPPASLYEKPEEW
jgi:hypothetical protein